MRWARTRGLPVRRLPGGKTGTVYALKDELDRWAGTQSGLDDDSHSEPVPLAPIRALVAGHKRLVVGGGAVLGLAMIATAVIFAANVPHRAPSPDLPSDPRISALYLQARDESAQRTPEDLQRAIAKLETTTRSEPKFAPAWTSLADAYLLSREFGTMSDQQAFPKARTAVETALRLDPQSPGALRAQGFILYWWEDRPQAAGKAFRRAIALAPKDAQTHFWYGNVLADNGQHVAALRELTAARLIEPGSVAIRTDLAWAQWSAGNEAEARQNLQDLARSHPDFAVIHDALAIIHIADGDYVGYVQELAEFARLRHDQSLTKHATDLRTALDSGADEVQRLLMARPLAEIAEGSRRTHRWPVFLASVAQNRQLTLDLLGRAEQRHEVWGGAGVTARITRLWMDDTEISRLIQRRKSPPVE